MNRDDALRAWAKELDVNPYGGDKDEAWRAAWDLSRKEALAEVERCVKATMAGHGQVVLMDVAAAVTGVNELVAYKHSSREHVKRLERERAEIAAAFGFPPEKRQSAEHMAGLVASLRAQLEELNKEMDRRAEDSLGRERELKAALNSAQASVAREVNAERERDALKAKLERAREALRVFMELDYGEWRGRMHEEGCPGVQLRPEERSEGEECTCDGDECTSIIEAALSDSKPTPDVRQEPDLDPEGPGKKRATFSKPTPEPTPPGVVRSEGWDGQPEVLAKMLKPTPEVAKPGKVILKSKAAEPEVYPDPEEDPPVHTCWRSLYDPPTHERDCEACRAEIDGGGT